MKNSHRIAAFSLVLSGLFGAPAAQAYDELVVFGDSLSDNGNIYNAIFGYLPTAPYYQGRFSNGPVAVEIMADKLGIPLVDLAHGGASAGRDNEYLPGSDTGLRGQINAYLAGLQSTGADKVDARDLFVVQGGGNDLLGPIRADLPIPPSKLIEDTVDELAGNVQALYAAGARDVLVPLLPDLSTTRYGTSGSISPELLSSVSTAFNTALRERLDTLTGTSPGLTLRIFDTFSVLADFRQSMQAAGGNVTDRCWTGDYRGPGTLCADPDNYYLFDNVHPTAVVHRYVGEKMAAAVPEPGTWALLFAGVAVLAVRGAAKKAQKKS